MWNMHVYTALLAHTSTCGKMRFRCLCPLPLHLSFWDMVLFTNLMSAISAKLYCQQVVGICLSSPFSMGSICMPLHLALIWVMGVLKWGCVLVQQTLPPLSRLPRQFHLLKYKQSIPSHHSYISSNILSSVGEYYFQVCDFCLCCLSLTLWSCATVPV